MEKNDPDVLVVGAGPTGLMCALILASEGISVRIIDQGRQAATRSYACLLHASTLRLFHQLNLLERVQQHGCRIDRLSLYDDQAQRATLSFSEACESFPYLVSMPQGALEHLLEEHLADQFHISVEWNHRLVHLSQDAEGAAVAIEKVIPPHNHFILQDWDWRVQSKSETKVSFVVGADGHYSAVRRSLGIEFKAIGTPELFAIFEFETPPHAKLEAGIAIASQMASAVWPLPCNRLRWSFQLPMEQAPAFPRKDREAPQTQGYLDEIRRHYAQDLIRTRAPWFSAEVGNLDWAARICFQPGLVQVFGKNRCWLAGDAAHQAGPVGAQSFNAGMSEAEELARILASIMRDSSQRGLLQQYNTSHQQVWSQMLQSTSAGLLEGAANLWTKENADRLLNCLPATGLDLGPLYRAIRRKTL